MQIFMMVDGSSSSFDTEDIIESGQTLGKVIGEAIDEEIATNHNLKSIIVEVQAG